MVVSIRIHAKFTLSKAYLRGESTLDQALVRPLADYDTHGIQLLRGRRAVTLDPALRQLNLDDGTNLTYGALLIATGSAPRHLGSTPADHKDPDPNL